MQFIIHILNFALIFSIIACGFRFFIKIKWNCDYSYIAIVIFSSYLCAILNTSFWIGMIGSFLLSLVWSIPFTLLVFYLSKRLNDFYFSMGTFALYILIYLLAYNLNGLTNWVYWIANVKRILFWNILNMWIQGYLLIMLGVSIIAFWLLYLFKKSSLYKSFVWWWESELVTKSLWISSSKSKFLIICLSALLATLAWSCYTFYYCYVAPWTFRISTLILILSIVFLSYKYNEFGVIIISIIMLFLYEWLRFLKVVDPSKIWYLREMIFSLIIIIVVFITFKKINFWREE